MADIYVADTSPDRQTLGNEREPRLCVEVHSWPDHAHAYSKISQFPFCVRNRKRIGTFVSLLPIKLKL